PENGNSTQIDYPKVHQSAGGTGTRYDPITFDSDPGEFPPGTMVYIPYFQRYFVMEDSCDDCTLDWTSTGPEGGPGFRLLEIWLTGGPADPDPTNDTATPPPDLQAFLDCEDRLGQDSTSVMVNPPDNLAVSSKPFVYSNGTCPPPN
ncbi:MAG TPA: hypothetical protein VG015_05510, partial [Candidatus Dormibacteraeota bacterium]|nr:hypothetical protein [Candidatus Dormibacteraeota bacterium]